MRVVVHVFFEGFLRAFRNRPFDEILSATDRLSAVLAEHGSGWWKPSADEAVLVRDHPWDGERSPMEWASSLRQRITDQLGLDCSIGIASTRLAARICSRLARPRGILLWMPGHEHRLVHRMPLEELDELRPDQLARLRSEGIRTLEEMAALSSGQARTLMGMEGERVVGLVRGTESGHDRASGERVERAISVLARRLSRRLENARRRARGLELLVVFADGVTRERYALLAGPTSRAEDFRDSAARLMASAPERHEPIVGLSLNATGLTSFAGQLDLFSRVPAEVRVALGRVDLLRPFRMAETPDAPGIDTGNGYPVCSRFTLGGSCP